MLKVKFDNKDHFLEGNQLTVGLILKKMKINPEMVLISKNGELVLEDEVVTEKDSVEVLKVVSGG